MTKFCRTHVVDRSIPELRQRKWELEARDLSDKPGLQAEYGRVCSMLSLRLVEAGRLDGRPSTSELLGVDPGWTGNLSVDEFMDQARRRRNE